MTAKHQGLDFDLGLSRTLRWTLFGLYCFCVYVIVSIIVTWPSRPITSFEQLPWWSSVIAMVVVIITYVPVSTYLHRSVHQLVYGQHDDAYAILERVSGQLDATPDSGEVLPTLAATLASTLRLPYVAIESTASERPMVAAFGQVPDDVGLIAIPLRYRSAVLGSLSVSPRGSRDHLSAADLRLLGDLARHVSITLHGARLTAELQASREELVVAREEERRRIRRDLHDGLGPTLASLQLQLGALRRNVRHDPGKAERSIDGLRQDTRSATAEIRRLVYDLRPPMLDELGLVEALHNLRVSDGLRRRIDVPAVLPRLAAATEVAIYRIANEALHNISTHAKATSCVVSLTLQDDGLRLAITDDGRGLPAAYHPGVGHQAMRERTAELGGSLTIAAAPTGGTRVTAVFPQRAEPDG